MTAARAPMLALDVMCASVDHRAAGNGRGLRTVVGEYPVDDRVRSDGQLATRHIDVAAHVSIDARTARADLQILSYSAVDDDVATADGEAALNLCLGTDLDVPPANAGIATDFPVHSPVTTGLARPGARARRPHTRPPRRWRRGCPGPRPHPPPPPPPRKWRSTLRRARHPRQIRRSRHSTPP